MQQQRWSNDRVHRLAGGTKRRLVTRSCTYGAIAGASDWSIGTLGSAKTDLEVASTAWTGLI